MSENTQKPNYTIPLIIMASMFFLFGFITTMSNSLIDFLKTEFQLSALQANMVNMAVYGAYIVSIPASLLIKKIGYKGGVIVGLVLIAVGYLIFYPAVTLGYVVFLIALLIVAIGAVLLQVAANPFVIALGDPKTSSSRLVLAQSMNSLATVIASLFVSYLILTEENKVLHEKAVQIPFLYIAGFTILLFISLMFIKLPVINEEDNTEASDVPVKSSVWKYKHMILGTLGIFFYMGVEVGIPTAFPSFSGYDQVTATSFLTFYWLGMFIGRFSGIWVLKKFSTAKVIATYSIAGALLLTGALISNGTIAVVLILMTGLFHSVLWPSIFNLAIKDLGPYSKQASGIICTAVIGGGILLMVQGALEDAFTVKVSLLALFVYYAYIFFFATKGHKIR